MGKQKPISKAYLLSQKIDKIFMKHGLKVTEKQKTGNFITFIKKEQIKWQKKNYGKNIEIKKQKMKK